MTKFKAKYLFNKKNSGRIFLYLGLIIASFISGYPLLWMFFNSFKDRIEIYTNIWGPPMRPNIMNYVEAWNRSQIQVYFKNSVIVTVGTILLTLILGTLAAYAFSKIKFFLSNVIFVIFLLTMMIQPQVISLPLFKLMTQLKIMDTYFALILAYVADSLPLSIFLLAAYFRSIPKDIEEAALIDGANKITVFFKIILPLSGPVYSAVIIINFVFYWNELILSLMLLKKQGLRTITVGLVGFIGQFQRDWGALFSALSISIIPVIIIYLIFQKRFISGLLSGAIKG